jgi:hypothetical protein
MPLPRKKRIVKVPEQPRVKRPSEKAKALLFEFLDKQQKDNYTLSGTITVIGASGRKWKVSKHYPALRLLDEEDRPMLNICVNARLTGGDSWYGGAPPAPDKILGMKLNLEHDDAAFFRQFKTYAMWSRHYPLQQVNYEERTARIEEVQDSLDALVKA